MDIFSGFVELSFPPLVPVPRVNGHKMIHKGWCGIKQHKSVGKLLLKFTCMHVYM